MQRKYVLKITKDVLEGDKDMSQGGQAEYP